LPPAPNQLHPTFSTSEAGLLRSSLELLAILSLFLSLSNLSSLNTTWCC
jgi:hypothetical protein